MVENKKVDITNEEIKFFESHGILSKANNV